MQSVPGSAVGAPSSIPGQPGLDAPAATRTALGASSSGIWKEIGSRYRPAARNPAPHTPVSVALPGRVPPAVQGDPSTPLVPFVPFVPLAPTSPLSPFAPAAPGAPGAPAGPA